MAKMYVVAGTTNPVAGTGGTDLLKYAQIVAPAKFARHCSSSSVHVNVNLCRDPTCGIKANRAGHRGAAPGG